MERTLLLALVLCISGFVSLGGSLSQSIANEAQASSAHFPRVGGHSAGAAGSFARKAAQAFTDAARALEGRAGRSRLIRWLDFLTTAEDGRLSYAPSFRRTATTLGEYMERIGLEPIGTFENGKGGERYLQRFNFPTQLRQGIPEGRHSYNIVGMLRANKETKRTIVISAHVDGVGTSHSSKVPYQGADDNASGTASALYAAEMLKRYQDRTQALDVNVVVLLTSGEEQGLLGSTAFTRIPNGFGELDVIHVLNTDMVSQPRNGKLAVFAGESYADENANRLFKRIDELTGEDGSATGLRRIQVLRGVDEDGGLNIWNRSDHKAFVDAGIESVFLTTGIHDRYHLGTDVFRLPNGLISPNFDVDSVRRVGRLFSRLVVDGANNGWFSDSKAVALPLQ